MSIATLIRRFQEELRRFCAAQGGNVLVTFTLLLVPIIGFVGAAIDYSRAASARSAMQGAVDSTALMLSKDASTLTQAQINAKATAYFNAMYNRPDVTGIQITPIYTSSGGAQIVVTGAGSVPTSFMRVMGISTMDIGVSSTVRWGNTRLRVALVLDTTGSMSSANKMTALKAATENLLKQLQAAAANPGDVYVSIIPFSKNVNLNPANYNATWIDWTEWEAEPAVVKATKPSTWDSTGPGKPCPFTDTSQGFVCTTGPVNNSAKTTSIPNSGAYKGYICPSVDSGKKSSTKIGIYYNGCYNSSTYTCTGSTCTCTGHSNCSCTGSGSKKKCKQPTGYFEHAWIKNTDRSKWNGCVTDRGASANPNSDYDRKVTAPSTSIPDSLFPAEQNSYCSPKVTALNYDWAAMKTTVNALYPLGATNQPIGLVWGWQSLVGGGPLTMPAKDSNYTYNEVIVLMSDGLNTLDRWYGNGSSTSTSVDMRMYESSTLGTCANIKAAGITIYAVHVNTDGDPMSTLLKNCASTADKFWMVTSANELGTVFNTIGTALSNLRVAK